MAKRIFSHRAGRPISKNTLRVSREIIGGRRGMFMVNGPLKIGVGTIVLLCEGVRIGNSYEIDASGFSWRSRDGLCYATNEVDFSGGNLTPSGDGEGTIIQRVLNNDPLIANIYLIDTDASG